MARLKKLIVKPKAKSSAPVKPEHLAQVADAPQPRVAHVNSPTTALVAEALRQNQADSGPSYARSELINALAGCCLYSLELDGLAATLALLADAASVVEKGFGDAKPSPGSRVH